MHMPNLLPFNQKMLAIQLQEVNWKDQTKAKSWQIGRRLYQGQLQQQCYWLKTQLKYSHTVLEQAYLKELQYYQQQIFPSLDFQILALNMKHQDCYPCLILPHAPLYLAHPPHIFTLDEIQSKILQLIECVEQVYQAGYLHADLKHEHFVEWQGQACLLDFEQSILLHADQPILTATPRYMAPELFHGAAKTIQTEIYALGIIVYEWLTQTRLPAKTYQQWAYLHCQDLRIQLPLAYESLQNLLEGMLAKHFQQRFDDFYQLKNMLNA